MRKLFALSLLFVLLAAPQAHPGDSTYSVPETVPANTGVPIGTIIAWPFSHDPADKEKWLDCDGRSVPTKYAKLRALGFTTTPNLNGRFLRGGTTSQLLNAHDDTLKTYKAYIDPHTHYFTGQLVSTSVSGIAQGHKYSVTPTFDFSGTADGQSFKSDINFSVTGSAAAQKYDKATSGSSGGGSAGVAFDVVEFFITSDGNSTPYSQFYFPAATASSADHGSTYSYTGSSGVRYETQTASDSKVTGTTSHTFKGKTNSMAGSGTAKGDFQGVTEQSGVTGNVNNQTVVGDITETGGQTAYYHGGDETAPEHMYVRYLIRARF